MELAAANWRWDDLHGEEFHNGSLEKWSKTRSLDFPYAHRDGVTNWIADRDLDPDNHFLRSADEMDDEPEPEHP